MWLYNPQAVSRDIHGKHPKPNIRRKADRFFEFHEPIKLVMVLLRMSMLEVSWTDVSVGSTGLARLRSCRRELRYLVCEI
jgi:hypothetical protein